MKTLIQIVLVALLVGGLSAGGSFYWKLKYAKPEATVADGDSPAAAEKSETSEKSNNDDDPENIDDVALNADDAHSDHGHGDQAETKPSVDEHAESADPKMEVAEIDSGPFSFGPPVGVRPPWDVNGDEAGELINTLRARAVSTSRQERRMAEREDAMNLIVDDLRIEQANSAKIRKRLMSEANLAVRAAEEARRATASERAAIYRASESERAKMREQQAEERRAIDEELQNLRREKEEATQSADFAMKSAREELDEMRKQLEEARKPPETRDRSASPEETANIKNVNSVMESMTVESTAKVLQDFVEKGRTESVVLILNGMKPQKSAKVLALIQESNAELVADLVDRLKKFKKPDGSKPAP